jgi:hypothetical protein
MRGKVNRRNDGEQTPNAISTLKTNDQISENLDIIKSQENSINDSSA